MEVYIIRHGKTDWNKEYRFQGAHDIPLNEEGKAAAVALGKRLASVQFDAFFSSPLSRAYETACLVRNQSCDEKTKSLNVQTDERIKEISFGELEGLPFDKWMATDEPRKYFFDKPGLYVPPAGGETLEACCERAADFIHKVIEPIYLENPHSRIMIVGHGAILAALMCCLDSRSVKNYWGNGLKGNCEETIYFYDGKKWQLTSDSKPRDNPYMKFAEGEGQKTDDTQKLNNSLEADAPQNATPAQIIKKTDASSALQTADILKNGGVVIIPTDTVYGFSGIVSDPARPMSLSGLTRQSHSTDDRIRFIKGRSETKPFIQLIAKPQDLAKYTTDTVPQSLLQIWPGPLTIIVNDKRGGTTAFRCPGDEWLRKIIADCGKPIYSTSVNRSGKPVLDSENEIIKEFGNEVNLIVTDGDKKGAKPSTIVSITEGEIKILRKGDVIIE